MDIVSKEELLKRRLGQEPVELPGLGTVIVRGLTRGELARVQGMDGPDAERESLAFGMVDPQLTREEVDIWFDGNAAMEPQPVVAVINRLSGYGKAAQKEAYKSAGSGPDPGI